MEKIISFAKYSDTPDHAETEAACKLRVQAGKKVLQAEITALETLRNALDASFSHAVSLLRGCKGVVLTGGVGKAGIIAQKFAATLASLGTPSHYVHPAEAVHGDLGKIALRDTVVLFSLSGETDEICRLFPLLREQKNPLLAITGAPTSALAREADVVLDIHFTREAGKLGRAPTCSTLAMLALADALALVLCEECQFTDAHFARFHPAGMLGRKLSRVEDYMRPSAQCRLACETETVRNVFLALQRPGRRTGAIMLTGAEGTLSGFFTDSDLSRLFERGAESAFDAPISEVMTRNPISVTLGSSMEEGVELMVRRKISELPVVDESNRPVGLLDVTDVIGLFPHLRWERP